MTPLDLPINPALAPCHQRPGSGPAIVFIQSNRLTSQQSFRSLNMTTSTDLS